MELTWSKYQGKAFQKYQISFGGSNEILKEITDVNTTKFIDTLYGGEYQNYKIKTIVGNQDIGGNNMYISQVELEKPSISSDIYGNVTIKWKKSLFPHGFLCYDIYRHPQDFS